MEDTQKQSILPLLSQFGTLSGSIISVVGKSTVEILEPF